MEEIKKPIRKEDPAENKKILFAVLKLLFIVVIILIVLFLATSPLRGKASENYVFQGDKYLSDKKFLSAELEYNKALELNPKSISARGQKELAERASKDILELENFYNKPQYTDYADKIKNAKKIPKTESEAVKLSKKFIEEREFQLAAIPAQTAIEMDKEYRDGWLYLGIANLKTAETIEARSEVRKIYLEKSKEAFKKAIELDPEYQPTQDFLKEANNL